MTIFIYIVSNLYIFSGAIIAFLYVLRGGKYIKAIHIGWGLSVLGAIFAALILPIAASRKYLADFPEAPGVVLIAVTGWISIAIVVAVAAILNKTILYFHPQSAFFGTAPRGKTRLYHYIGLFYLFIGITLSTALITKGSAGNTRAGREVLLYQTDHKALLEACRELSDQISAGQLEPNLYVIPYAPNQESNLFPQIITNLKPRYVTVGKEGIVDIVISPPLTLRYGVFLLPAGYDAPIGTQTKYTDESLSIELIDGLRYYDEDFQKHPERKKEIEASLEKNKIQVITN